MYKMQPSPKQNNKQLRSDKQMPIADILNLCVRYKFRVEIDGITRSGFKEVEGLSATIDVQEYREGTDPSLTNRLEPGLSHYGPLILRYAVTSSGAGKANKELWEWMHQNLDGSIQKKNVSVIVMDRKGNEVVRYNLTNAWPSNWRIEKLDSRASGPLIEEIILQYERLEVS